MSGQKDNHNKKLKDLLDKTGMPEDSFADDFEKDAAEGFSMLDREEAMQLKQQLDTKIYGEVLSKQKKTGAYWFAAAGLLLIVGLSIFFIRNEQHAQDKLAIATTQQQTETLPPPPPPAEAEISKEQKNKKPAESNRAEPEKPLQQPKAAQKKEAEELLDEEKDSYTILNAAPISAAPEMNSGPVGSREREQEETESKDKAEDFKKTMSKKVQATPDAVPYSSQSLSKSAPAPAGRLTMATEAEAKSDMDYSNPKPTLYYNNGEAALQKDLKEKLTAKNLLQKFDATLYINQNKVVEKATLKKTDLSKEQQRQVIEVLKSLDKFNYSGEFPEKKLLEYKLEFRP